MLLMVLECAGAAIPILYVDHNQVCAGTNGDPACMDFTAGFRA